MIVELGLDSDPVPTKTVHQFAEAVGYLMIQTGRSPEVYCSVNRIDLHFAVGLTAGLTAGLFAARKDLRSAIEVIGLQTSFHFVAADCLYSAVQITLQLDW